MSSWEGSKFNGGGHINHSLFWRSLAPASSPAASSSAAPELIKAIEKKYGSLQNFQQELKTLLLGIQGSGWGWLVKTPKGELGLVTTKDQDPVETLGGNKKAIFGIDMWEHAYYLQYWNDKGKYVDEIWQVINWETAERRWFGDATELLKL
jgi:Fe-Mn family superoxide dismutase